MHPDLLLDMDTAEGRCRRRATSKADQSRLRTISRTPYRGQVAPGRWIPKMCRRAPTACDAHSAVEQHKDGVCVELAEDSADGGVVCAVWQRNVED